MHVVIPVVSPIITFELELVPMFFHMDSIKEFKKILQIWNFTTTIIIIVDVRGRGNNKGENQLLIINGEGEFDQDVFALCNNFKTEYEKLLEAYNEGQCVLIKNVASKRLIFKTQ